MNAARRRLVACLAAGWSLAACAQPRASAEYLVTLSSAASESTIVDAYGRFGIKSATRIASNVFLVVFDDDPGLAALENARSAAPAIRAVQRNQRYKATD